MPNSFPTTIFPYFLHFSMSIPPLEEGFMSYTFYAKVSYPGRNWPIVEMLWREALEGLKPYELVFCMMARG